MLLFTCLFVCAQNLMFQPHFLSSFSQDPSRVVVASQMGMFQFVNTSGLLTPDCMSVHQIMPLEDGMPPCVFTLAVAPSDQFIVLGDGYGVVHSWVSPTAGREGDEAVAFNPYAAPSVFPNEQPIHLPYIDFNQPLLGAPLSALPMYRFR